MVTGDMEPRAEQPQPEPIHVPATRLDEVEHLRAELARVHAELAIREQAPVERAVRTNQLGPWTTTRVDAAEPLRTAATEDRRTAAADIVLGLRAMGAVGLAVAGVAALTVVLVVLYGLFRLAARFAAWSGSGGALAGGLVLVAACVAIVGTGLYVFLRLTGRRADR